MTAGGSLCCYYYGTESTVVITLGTYRQLEMRELLESSIKQVFKLSGKSSVRAELVQSKHKLSQ